MTISSANMHAYDQDTVQVNVFSRVTPSTGSEINYVEFSCGDSSMTIFVPDLPAMSKLVTDFSMRVTEAALDRLAVEQSYWKDSDDE